MPGLGTAARAAAATAGVLLVVGLAACGSDSESGNESERPADASATVTEKQAGAASPDEVVTFVDDFDGPQGTPPDPAKWVPKIQSTAKSRADTNELGAYTDNENAALDGSGNLVIEARKEAPGATCTDAKGVESPCEYTSGRLSTRSLFSQQGGRFEARIKTPMGNTEAGGGGVWPAFWLLGRNERSWPSQGEIDIHESRGHKSETAGFFHSAAPNSPGFFFSNTSAARNQLSNMDFSQFHTFAVDVEPTSIAWSIDDVPVYSVDRTQFEKARPGATWVADQPWYAILNLAVGGWSGTPKEDLLPKQLVVDYVRMSCPYGTVPFDPSSADSEDASASDVRRVRCRPKPA
jgi:beta-glucanase (GH16 family)